MTFWCHLDVGTILTKTMDPSSLFQTSSQLNCCFLIKVTLLEIPDVLFYYVSIFSMFLLVFIVVFTVNVFVLLLIVFLYVVVIE